MQARALAITSTRFTKIATVRAPGAVATAQDRARPHAPVGRRHPARWLLAVVVAVMTVLHGGGSPVLAQLSGEEYGYQADTLDGIEQAVGRFYSDADMNYLGALVFRFDSEASAAAGLEALDPGNSSAASAWEDLAVAIDSLGPDARAYHSEDPITGISTEILIQEEMYVYVADATGFVEGFDSTALATETILAMMEGEAGEGTGELDDLGGSTGGPWDKLPPGDGQAPAGFGVDYDAQFFPEPPDTSSSEASLDFSQFEGAQRAVARTYSGDLSVMESPESVPATTYYLAILVAEFDTDSHAAAALDGVFESGREGLVADTGLSLEATDMDPVGDLGRAAAAVAEEDGLTTEVTMLVVQDGSFVYVVVAVGLGADAGTMASATAAAEATIAADTGAGEGTFDGDGGSTGGLWDKLPVAGDDVLQEMAPNFDEQVYPEDD